VIPQTRRFSFESTLELLPDCDVNIEASGYYEIITDVYGDDADGRRGEVRTEITEVTIVVLWAYFPGRPPIKLAERPTQVCQFLTKVELAGLEELACERVFSDDGGED
jgi:hypothetical protein